MCHHIWHVGLTREKWLKPKIISILHHRIKGKKHTHKSFNWVNDEEGKEKEEKEKEEEEDDNI